MKKLGVLSLYVLITSSFSYAQSSFSFPCNHTSEESLINFMYEGQEYPSELIGTDKVDCFGGTRAVTPKHKIAVYVNFNIEGTIDLKPLEDSFAEIKVFERHKYKKIIIVVVSDDWMIWRIGELIDWSLNSTNNIFFITEHVLKEGRFDEAVSTLYSSKLPPLLKP